MGRSQKGVKPTFGERTPAESPRDEPPSQAAQEKDAAAKIQDAMRAKDKKKKQKGEKDRHDKKKAKQGGNLAKPKEINPSVEEPPANNTRAESSLQEAPNQKEDASAAKGQGSKKGVKPTFGERPPAESPRDEPPSQAAQEKDAAVKIQDAMGAKDKKKKQKGEKDRHDKKKAKQGGDLAKPKEINPSVEEP